MGLDMYLYARDYIPNKEFSLGVGDQETKVEVNPIYEKLLDDLNLREVVEPQGWMGFHLEVPIGYWRKVNAIHNWFVNEHANGIDECQRIHVDRQDLINLEDTCKTVLKAKDPDVSGDLLPSASGFFFGSVDYDEWYYAGIEETIEITNRAINSKFNYFIYQASW